MKRKKELIVILSSLLVIVLSVSVAYFTTKILGTGKEISVESADLKVIFTSGSGTINGTNIEPGWSSGENTFTVKNESNGTYKYNIIIKDLVNTFTTSGFLVYKITSTDDGYNMTDFADVPKNKTSKDTILAYNISIDKGATHTYTVEYKYLESTEVDQSADMGKTLTGKIFITEGTERPTLYDQLLADKTNVTTRTGFNTVLTADNTKTLYTSTENGTTVYYFAGNATDNWVKFGKNSSGEDLYWRIIRTNADGSIRLLYHSTSTTATDAYISTSVYNASNNSPKYVGYMYGDTDATLDEARTNTNDTTIKTTIDTWYENNLKTNYGKYLSETAVYCNDREVGKGTYSNNVDDTFVFAANTRLSTNKTPTYDCTNTNDKFTVSDSTGNGKLDYPIGLMTADEISFAGGVYDTNAPAYYYRNSSSTSTSSTGATFWWTMTPSSIFFDNYVFVLVSEGKLFGSSLSSTFFISVRPVTSLKSCVKYSSGDGSADNPYTIDLDPDISC